MVSQGDVATSNGVHDGREKRRQQHCRESKPLGTRPQDQLILYHSVAKACPIHFISKWGLGVLNQYSAKKTLYLLEMPPKHLIV